MKSISEISCLLRNGKSIKQESEAGGLPITRIETIADWTIDPSRVGFANLELEDAENWLLENGDILISHINSVKHLGKCAIYRGTPERLVHGINLLVLRPNLEVARPDFVYRMMTSPQFRLQLPRITKNSVNQASFNISRFKELQIPLPPLDEQKRIAGILDAADSLRAKRKQALAHLDDLLQSTFLTLFGDPVTNPMGWTSENFGELCDSSFRNGLSPSTKGVVEGEVLTLSAITGSSFDFSARKTALFDKPHGEAQRLSTDTFLICRGNGNKSLVGKGVFPDRSNESVCFPDTMIGATINRDRLNPKYLGSVWNSRHVRNQIEQGARSTNGTQKVNQTLLASVNFPLPPLPLQQRFATIVEQIEAQKARHRAHLAELDTLFASLQSRAFSGEL